MSSSDDLFGISLAGHLLEDNNGYGGSRQAIWHVLGWLLFLGLGPITSSLAVLHFLALDCCGRTRAAWDWLVIIK